MTTGLTFLLVTLMVLAGVAAFVLLIIFIMVPLFRGIGWTIAAGFRGIGWFFAHILEFIGGMIGDALRFVGAILAMLVLAPLSILNVIIGRWSAASHFAESVKREFYVTGACLYRILLRRPLKLLWLHGLLEGLEQRVPEAMYAVPGSDQPRHRAMQFEGYTIVGSLAGGGSGGKLYIARPDDSKQRKLIGRPEHVVIKSFTLSEGSSLPQIVRESRALECAKQLGHVLDHGMDDHRFFYVMPYHPGDHLGIITRQLHGESEGSLGKRQLAQVMGYITDLLATLSLYHEGGLWHKDVKPENIIVHDGRAHLVDLGLVTPLKSAMTLTTHGTEYFRDPEMVRQALRGVKVHQVNGAKFDIYAVGAVLYYMIENTFPAHGGLSRFTKASPEALRWIVRRAMAEYNQRYASAAMMLADITAVTESSDPMAFKPADLPSMRGSNVEDLEVEADSPQAAQVHAAGTPRPRNEDEHWGAAVGAGARAASAQSGGVDGGERFADVARRPLLRLTNWWTGAYTVDDDGRGGSSRRTHPTTPPVRPLNMRRSAREQVKHARARAMQLQQRATSRRHKVGLEREPSPMLGFLVVAFLVIVGLIAVPFISSYRGVEYSVSATTTASSETEDRGRPLLLVLDRADATSEDLKLVGPVLDRYETRGYHVVQNVGLNSSDVYELFESWQSGSSSKVDARFEDVLAEHDLYGFLHIKVSSSNDGRPKVSETLIRSGRNDAASRRRPGDPTVTVHGVPAKPFLLINDHPAKTDAQVSQAIDATLDAYRSRGWKIDTDVEIEAAVRKALPAVVASGPAPSARLQQILHEQELGGVLYIDAQPGDAPAHERIRFTELAAHPAQSGDDIPQDPE